MTDQKQVVEALLKPETYGQEVKQIELKQTHISFVFLNEEFVYKVKKAVNFGFLDFSTLEKRRIFCEKELILNKRLCGEMYLEVVPITMSAAGVIKVNGEGKTIEYAVKMRRVGEDKIMTRLLDEGKVNEDVVDRIAKILADFHLNAKTGEKVGEFGSLQMVETNWKENFEQTEEFIGKSVSKESYSLIRKKVQDFMKKNAAFFANRVADNKVRECHGDVHSGNIFVADKIYIFDAIEFNERFRHCDVASEIAFLAMDLDYKGRSDLATFFVKKYVEYSKDETLEKIVPFYKCYRAYVRGKVTSFKLNDPNVNPEEKNAAQKEAKAYFELAAKYAKQL
ncbi:MAG: hypothetical protein CW716_11540 [Candidatus Bathyarchaeum sp.]|nr:MAG: hypothetical protein CW716_11540 [Candidatus Bathyarchaeum sp.]